MSLFYNCFLRLFGDGGFEGPEPPDPGCDDCGGGCTGEGCGCIDCDPGDDPCDDLVILADCPPNYEDLDVVECLDRVYSKQQLVDAQCIQECTDPVVFGCEDCLLGFPPSKCAECCPSNPDPPDPTFKTCKGFYCATKPCDKTYAEGGCVEQFTTNIPSTQDCPTQWNGNTVYPTLQAALIGEVCYSTDPTLPTSPGGGGGGGGGGAPGRPPQPIAASQPCTLWTCIIISSDTDADNPGSGFIDRECLEETQTVGAWYRQFTGTEITGPASCETIKGVASAYGRYGEKAQCEANCQDETYGPDTGPGANRRKVFVCVDGVCESKVVDISQINFDGTLNNTGQQSYPTIEACQGSAACCTPMQFRFWRCDMANDCGCVQDVLVESCTLPPPPAGAYEDEAACNAASDCCKKDTQAAVQNLANLYPFDTAGGPSGGIPMGYCEGESVTLEPSDAAALAELSNDFLLSFNATVGIEFDANTGNIDISNAALTNPNAFFQLFVERDCCDDTQQQRIDVLVSDITRQLTRDNPLCSDPGGPTDPGGPGGTGNNRVFNNTGAGDAEFSYDDVLAYRTQLEELPDQDLLYDPLVEDRIFKLSNSTNQFTPVQNPGYDTHILGGLIHASVYYAYRSHLTGEVFAAFDDLGGASLLKSLRPELQRAVKNARDTAGQSLTVAVLDKIAYLIRQNRLSELTYESLADLNQSDQNQFGDTGKGIGSDANAIRFIDDALKPLYHESYTGVSKDKMRLWKTVAPDVNKHIALIRRDGTVLEHPISIDDKYFIQYGASSIQEHQILDGDFFNYRDRFNQVDRGGVFSDIARAFMLDLKDATIANKLLGSNNDVTLLASSIPIARIEETADLSSAHPEVYYLKLIPSSIEDMERDRPLVRKSTCRFKWEQDMDVFNEWIKFKPWPYLVVNVDHEDPFLDHLNKRKSINAIFRDVSFDYYKGYEDEYPVVPRRIPWYIVIVPTDDPSKTIQYSSSRLIDYSVREINVSMLTPLGKGGKLPMRFAPPGISVHQSPPTRDIDLDQTRVGGYEASADTTTISGYSSGSEPLPRRPSAFRKFMESVRGITSNETFIDASTSSASWGDIYRQLDQSTKQALKRSEVKEWNRLKELYALGRPTPSSALNEELPKLFRVPPRGITTKEEFKTPVVTARRIDIIPETAPPPIIL